jgi:Acyl-CoA thioesterase C-terminal domain/Acyl-CoA thioesterase N-terminal domain
MSKWSIRTMASLAGMAALASGTMLGDMEPLFRTDGDRFVPSEHTRGPWDPAAQHAGPPAALLGRSLERIPSEVAMHVARFSMELLRPVPLLPLRVRAVVVSAGRRVQRLHAALTTDDGTEVATASAIRIRTAAVDLADVGPPAATLRGPDTVPTTRWGGEMRSFATTGVELRFEQGDVFQPGPAAVWIRLRHPVVDDETPTPLQRTLAAADFGNGVSAVLDWQRYLFINPDLTVACARPMTGEWVCLEATSQLESQGTGLAHSRLHDVSGPFGHALQTLLVDVRAAAG